MARQEFYETQHHPKTLLVGIQTPYNKTKDIDSYFEEFVSLVNTNGIDYELDTYLKLRDIHPAFFITRGKLDRIKEVVDELEIEDIIVSEMLTPQQERNIGDYLGVTVCDRTKLILEIFEKAAHSAEGKTQVAIAMLQHDLSRLAGKGIHLSQQAGAVGLRGGPGETLKEREKRHIKSEIVKLRKQLKKIQQSRDTQRKRRLNNQIPHISLIGYTNAGKSTILNALTNSKVLAEDKLFATLDTTTRKLFVNAHEKGVLSDTVGFIQHLPPKLIEAFKSTLSELQYADLLIHVVDVSNQNWPSHIKVVNKILEDLGVEKEILYVFNKADQVKNIDVHGMELAYYQPHVVTNAHSKEGLSQLIDYLDSWKPKSVNNTSSTATTHVL